MGSKLLLLVVSLLLCLAVGHCKLNKETDCKCRIGSKSRIVNGRFAHHLSFPFLASLSYNSYRMTDKPLRRLLPNSLKMNGLTCTATIINERYLITAAVCLTSNLDSLTIGLPHSNDLVKMFDDDYIPITRIIVHPKFNATLRLNSADKDFAYNLALIELASPISFGGDSAIAPACLAMAEKNRNKIYDEPLISAGYGAIVNQIDNFKSRLLKEIDLVDQSANTEECLANLKLMCLRSANKKDVLALNDLGGSVLTTHSGQSYVTSILSNLDIGIDHETETAYITDLSFAARLVESADWIRQYVKDDYCSDE